MSRSALAGGVTGLATLCVVAVLVTVAIGDGDPRSADGGDGPGVLVVRAAGDRRTPAVETSPDGDSASLTTSIRAAIPERDVEVRNVRIVDVARSIACGERTSPGSAVLRRFVWLGRAGIVVTDDGGADFANLFFVCDPSRPRAR